MKTLLGLIVSLLIASFAFNVVAQELGSSRKGYKIALPDKPQRLALSPLPPGVYSVGSGGYFPTIDSAFNRLSVDGIAGAVTLELIDSLYTAPADSLGFLLNGPIPGAAPNSRVTIKPKGNKNVKIEGDGLAVLDFFNTSYVTVDGVGLTGTTTLTIHSYQNLLYSWNDNIHFMDNSDHNVIQNVIFISEDRRSGAGPVCASLSGSSTPDSNLIQNNFIKEALFGIQISTYLASARAKGNIIRGNMVGSETDSLIAWGIEVDGAENTIIEDNIIQNMRGSFRGIAKGVNAFNGVGDTVRNNTIHTIIGMNGGVGIAVGGEDVGYTVYRGYNNVVYNNMVSDVGYSSSPSYLICGIRVREEINVKIYFNSVFLSGTGSISLGSAALYVESASQGIDARNNVLVNTRNESPFCASAIYDYDASNILISDYNNLYNEPTQNSCLVRIGSAKYTTLAAWQATGKDLHSVTEIPHFVPPYLHIGTKDSTRLESRGIPIVGITTDFDHEARNATTPDIGADEFGGIAVGVEGERSLPAEYALRQNYPNPFNPTSTIKYELPKALMVRLSVYDILGREVSVLVNERKNAGSYEVKFDVAGLSSGVYLYRLQAGDFVQSRKLMMLK